MNQVSDLSSGEDLSFALMNLISIEEHLACSFARTGDPFFVEALPDIRNLRRDLMKQVVREGYGEGWCISKHLLATAMRLLEVANKRQAEVRRRCPIGSSKRPLPCGPCFGPSRAQGKRALPSLPGAGKDEFPSPRPCRGAWGWDFEAMSSRR